MSLTKKLSVIKFCHSPFVVAHPPSRGRDPPDTGAEAAPALAHAELLRLQWMCFVVAKSGIESLQYRIVWRFWAELIPCRAKAYESFLSF